MDVFTLRDYVFYDFIEDVLGFSLRGSGRIVNLLRENTEIVVSVKIYRLSGCINSEFIFTNERCIWAKNYWKNVDITSDWNKFLETQHNHSY